jgi:predicted MFS family arabinose efflux permease
MRFESSMQQKVTRYLMILLATSCGLIVANLYYAQPLVGLISASAGIPPAASGLIVTMTQIGYVIGLLFLVPLSDLVENRKLITAVLGVAVLGLILSFLSKTAFLFFLSAFLIGIGSVVVQILVPFAASIAEENERGRVVGKTMSGLLLGIMLARPVASMVASQWGWRQVFLISAIICVILTILLSALLPKRIPSSAMSYRGIIKSLWILLRTYSVLRQRSLYQASLFCSFSLFWTVTPLWLAQHFHLSQKEIALFALVGVCGAIAAPIAGRLADRGWSRKLTGIAFITAVASFAITFLFRNNASISLIMFYAAAILLDVSVSGNLVLGQQAIYSLGDEIRGRVNGIFMALFFIGGAIGSAIGGWAFAHGSWTLASLIGLSTPLLAFLYYLAEGRSHR